MTHQRRYDVVVVGAGIVGLAHAYHAANRGLSVAVIDHADRVAGASVQNFGHACITAQSGVARDYARAGREHWLDLARKAGFWSAESGTYCVARHDDELAVMTEFADVRGPAEAELLSRDRILGALPIVGDRVVGGMYMADDLQVNPREAAPAIAQWLEASGVDFFWRTAATGFETGAVRTSRGDLRAGTVFVTVNYDIDRLFPEPAERAGLLRCRLHMMRARIPLSAPLPAPLFTGWSLVRYSGFENLPATAALAARLRDEYPDYVDLDLHQMYTPQPDGSILMGDTHIREISAEPFQSEKGFEVLIREAAALFGVSDVTVTERWQGVYSSAPGSEFLIEEPIDGVHIVTVTTGIGMTTSMGLAKDRIEHVFGRETLPVMA
ncbi:MAG: TIGR03364 family FAD-dependent oxidoreductase [Rhodococcus sp. (in: high G+C Gram-positive bacteria)]|nr:MAG: TIGR03364 family FAD-dependent oxidoreductase [Rhodococcus sp. (in: high G+C Gram-positive bacteria)]